MYLGCNIFFLLKLSSVKILIPPDSDSQVSLRPLFLSHLLSCNAVVSGSILLVVHMLPELAEISPSIFFT